MILKSLLLLIALSYAYSAPTSSVLESAVLASANAASSASSKTAEVQVAVSPIAPVSSKPIESESDRKLSRATRANKVEYVYVNSEGEIINRHNALTKNLVPEKEVEKVVVPKEVISNTNKRNAESSDEAAKDDSTDALHYSNGGLKLGQTTRRQASALPSATQSGLTQTLNAPPLIPSQTIGQSIYSPIDYLPSSGQFCNPLLSPYYSTIASSSYNYPQSYLPLMQSIYNPYLNSQSYDPLLFGSQSYYNPLLVPATGQLAPLGGEALSSSLLLPRTTPVATLTPSPELEIRRNLRLGGLDWLSSFLSSYPYYMQNRAIAPLSINSLLLGQQSNLPLSTPYINPLLAYLMPQQSSSINYLLASRSGLGGSMNSGYNTLGLYPDYLRPLWSALLPQSPAIGAGLYPFPSVLGGPFPGIIPNPYSLGGNQLGGPVTQTLYPQQNAIVSRRPAESVATETVTTSNILPFSDSVASVTPTTTSTNYIIPGHLSVEKSVDKPLLYSSQNAELRTIPHDHYPSSNVYSARLLDPFTGLPYTARYPTSPLYARYSSPYYPSYPYSSAAYSPYYRPASLMAAPYPGAVYGPYNGVGYVHSPMHYSADTSILGKKNDQEADPAASKPAVPKEQGKEGLMYTIKTSKTESKETVSRLNPNNNLLDSRPIRDEDKKA